MQSKFAEVASVAVPNCEQTGEQQELKSQTWRGWGSQMVSQQLLLCGCSQWSKEELDHWATLRYHSHVFLSCFKYVICCGHWRSLVNLSLQKDYNFLSFTKYTFFIFFIFFISFIRNSIKFHPLKCHGIYIKKLKFFKGVCLLLLIFCYLTFTLTNKKYCCIINHFLALSECL